MNAYPQFTTAIDGQNIHFFHIRSPEPHALPLLLTHGWPGSVAEYLDVFDALSDPRSQGADPADAFHLVVPSLPGYGFSGPTRERGWNRYRIAGAWAELMGRLGYERFGTVGNDAGSMVNPEIGRRFPDRVIGVHVTQLFSFPSGDPADFDGLSEADLTKLGVLQNFWENMGAFNTLQSQQPQTLAYAISDSPAGLLGWNVQLFPREDVDRDFVLTNVAIYWFTGTAGSSTRLYYEDKHAGEQPTEPTVVPTALANFKDDFQSIRRFADRDHSNIVSWNEYDTGSHYAANDSTDLLLTDIRSFYRALR